MLDLMEKEDADVVSGWRKDRKDSRIRTFPSQVFNNFIQSYLSLPTHFAWATTKRCISP